MADHQEKKTDIKVTDLEGPCLVTPEDAERMRSRVVVLEAGKETGTHVTSMREEILLSLEGTIDIIWPGGEVRAGPGKAIYVPEGVEHNVMNRTDSAVRYIYVLALHADYERVKMHSHPNR